jgi:hypothetical protein
MKHYKESAMNLAELNWLQHKELTQEWQGMKIKHACAEYVFPNLKPAVGVDPGKNWGLSTLSPYPNEQLGGMMLNTWWGTFPTQEHDYDYFQVVMEFIDEWFPKKHPAKIALTEGAAYGAQYKQPMLEDIRLGFLMAFRTLGMEVDYVSPLKSRKAVFGSGKIKASDTWLSIGGNGADSGAICLYAGGYKYDER